MVAPLVCWSVLLGISSLRLTMNEYYDIWVVKELDYFNIRPIEHLCILYHTWTAFGEVEI